MIVKGRDARAGAGRRAVAAAERVFERAEAAFNAYHDAVGGHINPGACDAPHATSTTRRFRNSSTGCGVLRRVILLFISLMVIGRSPSCRLRSSPKLMQLPSSSTTTLTVP